MTALDPATLLKDAASIRSLALALVRDPGHAEDVSQEALLRRMRTDDSGVRSRRVWLGGIVRSAAAGLRRSEARRALRERSVARPERLPSTVEILAAEELRRAVVEAVLALDEPWRSVMLLHHLKQRPLREVARQLEVPIETARTRNKRGLALLRERLDGRFGQRSAWAAAIGPTWLEPLPASFGSAAASLPLTLGLPTLMTGKTIALVGLGLVALLAWSLSRPESGEPALPQQAAPGKSVESSALGLRESEPGLGGSREPAAEIDRNAASAAASPVANDSDRKASLRIEVVERESLAPVPDLQLVWTEDEPNNPARTRPMVSRTDADGGLDLQDLAPGQIWIMLQSLHAESLVLEPGEARLLRIEIPRGFTLSGRVLDGEGLPIADAEIVLNGMNSPVFTAFATARSDASGRFELPWLDAEHDPFISARAKGFAPSDQIQFRAPSGSTVERDLVLDQPGGALRGRVIDAEGQGVAGAILHVGDPASIQMTSLPDGSLTMQPPARHGVTGSDAGFEIPFLAVGEARVRVLAEDFAPATQTVNIEAGGDTWLELRLEAASRLEGVVRNASGEPISSAAVRAGDGDLFDETCSSAEDGSFVLRNLPNGDFQVRVDRRGYIGARVTAIGRPGESTHLDPVLRWGASIAGRVDCPGVAVSGWQVHAHGSATEEHPEGDWSTATVDGQGRFRLDGLTPESTYSLQVYDPTDWRQLAVASDVAPNAGEEQIAVDPQLFETGTVMVRGRVVDLDGLPVPNAGYVVTGPGSDRLVQTLDDAEGNFEAGPFLPGSFYIEVRATGFAQHRSDALEATAGQTLEFGELRLDPGGRIEVHVSHAPGVTPGLPFIDLRGESSSMPMHEEDGYAVAAHVEAGDYEIEVFGGGSSNVAQHLVPVRVDAGETLRVDVRLERGYTRTLLVPHPDTAGGSLHLLVTDAQGGVAHRGFLNRRPDNDAFVRQLRLASGEYRLEGWTDEDLRFTAQVDFGPEHEEEPLALELLPE